ncbi:Na+/H+ antiporter NhaC family protein [Paraglaciecola aquimarina]|uniref:Na+/H+ antiporter NhaC family protein n=1 Tax=Paraglaciecola aquimarina TaxID=1235557 RepID=A0ABU3SUC4_9ALTE|nr:Na+/H+ antiporter NhaC family protein [Paraglaciecola aquimarina]MDU0353597.1 Na+/H+ antiporter NhaC family protein [Paraglaciecola aquimarina]
MFQYTQRPSLLFFIGCLICAVYINLNVAPQWVETQHQYQTYENTQGVLVYKSAGEEKPIGQIIHYEDSQLNQVALNKNAKKPALSEQWVMQQSTNKVVLLKADFHFGLWSLLPAFVAVALCLMTREPLVSLLGGIVIGAIMLGRFDITHQIFIPSLATSSAASILILYLWLLGGLMGMWAKTGAAQAFADYMTLHYVKGPRSAKVITWMLGIIFFQGGTMSTVLVGTTVKPIADKAGVSHEELSYIVDSTASPIASIIAFNAWPAYIQAFLFIPGVAFLATEQDRISFFFASIPFSFYAMLAVLGTLLLSLNVTTFSGRPLKNAIVRVNNTGQLDGPNASPISAKELQQNHVPAGYQGHMLEFVVPLLSLIIIAVISYFTHGSPQIHWAFSGALATSILMAMAKGMSLKQVLDGFGNGLKGVVVASVILMFALTIGILSKQLGGGIYLVDTLGSQIPFWCLPIILQLMTMVIAFSTGTSWGTYAIAFPLALPLAWAIAQTQGLANPELFMMICFATVLNGSVYGDQCSPISDTTILSAMTTGCDLMDHVKSQIIPATYAATLAALLWTACVCFFTAGKAY